MSPTFCSLVLGPGFISKTSVQEMPFLHMLNNVKTIPEQDQVNPMFYVVDLIHKHISVRLFWCSNLRKDVLLFFLKVNF